MIAINKIAWFIIINSCLVCKFLNFAVDTTADIFESM